MIRKAAVCLLLAVSLTLTTQAMELPRQESSSTVASDTDLPLSPSQRVNKEILLEQHIGERRRMLEKDEEEAARAHATARDALRRAKASYNEAHVAKARSVYEQRLAKNEFDRVWQIYQGLKEVRFEALPFEGFDAPADTGAGGWRLDGTRDMEVAAVMEKQQESILAFGREKLYFLERKMKTYSVALDELKREEREADATVLACQRELERARTAIEAAKEHVERMSRRREKAMLKLVECEMEETLVGQTTRETVRDAFSVLFSLFPAEVESCSVL